jgi:type IV secretory pathway TrbD component
MGRLCSYRARPCIDFFSSSVFGMSAASRSLPVVFLTWETDDACALFDVWMKRSKEKHVLLMPVSHSRLVCCFNGALAVLKEKEIYRWSWLSGMKIFRIKALDCS